MQAAIHVLSYTQCPARLEGDWPQAEEAIKLALAGVILLLSKHHAMATQPR